MANVKTKPEADKRKPAADTQHLATRVAAPKAEKQVQVDPRNSLERRRTMNGIVVSDKMTKTIVVEVDRQVRHGLYEKYLRRSTRYQAHDETNQAKMGDRVTLVESRPMSRNKRWVLQKILRRAGQVAEANV
jgi:small subunit ribosomal protein S17